MSRNSNHGDMYLYGICTNRDKDGNGTHCTKCDSKEIQKIRKSKDFVCEECGERLMKVENPDSGGNKKIKAAIACCAVIVALIIGIVLCLRSCGNTTASNDSVVRVDSDSIRKAQIEQDRIDSLRKDSIQKAKDAEDSQKQKESEVKEPKATPKPQPVGTSGTKDLGYAVYKGTLKNGLPDGVNGRLTFKTQHVIDSKDPKGRMAEPGDYVIGEFVQGHLVQGRWYSADNTLKGGIMIGM